MSEAAAFYEREDRWRKGTCSARLGDKWCIFDEGHDPPLFHVSDNGVAWATDETGAIFGVHAVDDFTAD